MALAQAFSDDLGTMPAWVLWWCRFMAIVFLMAIPFAFVRVEARWMVLVIALTIPLVLWIYSMVGYQRLLGLGHVIIWTPYTIYLWMRREKWRVRETISGKWIVILFATLVGSLILDYADTFRYVLGDRL